MAAYDAKPLFDNIIDKKVLDENVFSFYFNQDEGSQGSELTIGGTDSSKYSGEI